MKKKLHNIRTKGIEIVDRIASIRNIEYFALILILIAGFAVRMYKINNPIADWHSWRQADTASVAKNFITLGYDLVMPRYHDISSTQTGLFNPYGLRLVEFPLYNAYHAMAYELFPVVSFEIWGRLISIFSALGSAISLFIIGRRYMGKWYGLIVSGLYLALPYNIYFTRVILPEPFAVFWGLLALVSFIEFSDTKKYSYLYVSGFLFTIALLVKPYMIFYTLLPIVMILQTDSLKKVLTNKNYWIAFYLAFVPFALWRMWIQQYPEGIAFWKWTFNGDDIRFRPAFWYWIIGQRLGHLILGIGGLLPLSYALVTLKKKYLPLYALGIGMFLYVSIIATANVRHDYYQTIAVPAIVLLVTLGIKQIWESKSDFPFATKFILILSLGIMMILGAMNTREFYKVNNVAMLRAGDAVKRLTPEDSLVIAPLNGDTAFLYQTDRWGWPHVDRPIDELIQYGADYYISVNFADPQVAEFRKRFAVVEETPDYLILDLHKELSP